MRTVFLPEALEDIERLYTFLIDANPLAAQKAMLAIDEGIDLLLEYPRLGRTMDEDSRYRQLFVPFGKSTYVLRYRVNQEHDELVVVRVWHGRERRE
ncbi:MAG: type II toxin-antitoxin system RelE/ParE family toxin [Gammaproteobacteria bacterium]